MAPVSYVPNFDDFSNIILGEAPEMELSLRNMARQFTSDIYNEGVFIRGVIEFSNACKRPCAYCGLNSGNLGLKRYSLEEGQIISIAENIYKRDKIKTVILQAGEVEGDVDRVCRIVEGIRKFAADDCAITISIGTKTKAEYQRLWDAGANRYLLKFETSNEEIYKRLCPDMPLQRRIEALYHLKAIGFEVGTGNIIGLPGTDVKDLYNDLLLIKEIGPHMIACGPFIPHSQTPLAGKICWVPIEAVISFLCAVRCAMPYALLPATSALASLGGRRLQISALYWCANVLMLSYTPENAFGFYTIYDGKSQCTVEEAKSAILSAQKRPIFDRGDSAKKIS